MIPLPLRDVEHGVRCAFGESIARHWMNMDERLPSIASNFEIVCDDLPLAAIAFDLSLSSSSGPQPIAAWDRLRKCRRYANRKIHIGKELAGPRGAETSPKA